MGIQYLTSFSISLARNFVAQFVWEFRNLDFWKYPVYIYVYSLMYQHVPYNRLNSTFNSHFRSFMA